MTFDHTHYYRFTTTRSGKDYALDVCPDGSGQVILAVPRESSGQYWTLVPLGDRRYALRTAYLGEGLSLAMDNNHQVNLKPTDLSAGQSWTLQPDGDEAFALINELAGPQTCLCLSGQGPVAAQSAAPSQHPLWAVTLCEAAYRVNDSASFSEGGTSLTLTVLQQFGSSFHVKLNYARP